MIVESLHALGYMTAGSEMFGKLGQCGGTALGSPPPPFTTPFSKENYCTL